MGKKEFIDGLSRVIPHHLYLSGVEITFQVHPKDLGDVAKDVTVAARELGEEWGCGSAAEVDVRIDYAAITIRLRT